MLMAKLLKKYNGNYALATAAYNAGEDAVAKYDNAIPNYKETQTHNVNVAAGTAYYHKQDIGTEFAPASGAVPAATTPVTEPAPTAVPADSGASEPSAGLWGWPRGAPGTGAGWGFPGPLMPMFASIEVVQRTDTGEIAQRDTRRLAAASYPMPPHLGPSPYAEARV